MRVIGAIVLIIAAIYGAQPSIIQTSIVAFPMVLLIIVFFSFHVVIHAPSNKITASILEPNISVENSGEEETK